MFGDVFGDVDHVLIVVFDEIFEESANMVNIFVVFELSVISPFG
jgi:hypothetical protein